LFGKAFAKQLERYAYKFDTYQKEIKEKNNTRYLQGLFDFLFHWLPLEEFLLPGQQQECHIKSFENHFVK